MLSLANSTTVRKLDMSAHLDKFLLELLLVCNEEASAAPLVY
jgi:hypothetical protein